MHAKRLLKTILEVTNIGKSAVKVKENRLAPFNDIPFWGVDFPDVNQPDHRQFKYTQNDWLLNRS